MTDATSPVPPPTTKWQVNDPITVSVSETDINNDSEESLEGVVSFLGRVRELEEDGAGEEDWIAVRLTGKSVGKGSLANCLLSVQQTYWEPCPPNCAMMVRSHQVARRTLTRLEELRLRRELASSSASTTTSTATTTASAAKSTSAPTSVTASSSTDADVPNEVSKSTAAAAAAAAQMTPPRSSVPAVPGTRSKLEELKLRREALMLAKQRQKQQQELLALDSTTTLTSPSPKSRMATPLAAAATSAATTTADHSVVAAATDELIASLKSQVDTFTLALSNKDQENQQLRERLTVMEEQSSNQTRKVQTLQIQLEAAKVVTPPVETPTKALLKKSVEEVQQENELLQSTLTETRDELEASLGQLAVVQSRLTAAEQGRDAALTELTASKAQITLAHNQTKALSDQSDARGGADATHYKERAKLVADASTLRRKIEQMEAEKMELEATIEDITLDKEQLQEEKEALEDKNEEIKLDLDTAHMELEELRFELQDAQASVERASGTLGDTVTMVAGTEEVGQHDDTTDDMVSALQIQNARLREALIRLREQSTLEKMELTRQLRTLEREAETNVSMQAQNEELVALKQMFEEEINDLKDMVEQGAAFESMVEDLSDRVLALEEDNVALRTVVREMEEAAELTAEMEEVQADELKAMSLDMEGRDAIIRNLEEAIKMYGIRFSFMCIYDH